MSAVAQKKLALFGAGRVSEAYLEALPELPELELCALVEPDPARAARARCLGVPVRASVCELLERRDAPDVAVVCTPPATHAEVVQPLIRGGIDCLIETPLATHPEDARRLATTAERLGRTLCTAARLRAFAGLTRAAALVREGRIGRLSYVETTLTTKLDARASWRGDPLISGGGVWMDRGPDAIDAVETLAGPIERIKMVEEEREQRGAVEDEVVVEAEHAGGVLSRILLSWNRRVAAPIARCVGSQGEILVGWAQTVARAGDGEEVVACGFDPHGAVVAVLRDLLARRTRADFLEDPGPQTVEWIHAGYRSRRSTRWEIA